jgi:hypothetical protein
MAEMLIRPTVSDGEMVCVTGYEHGADVDDTSAHGVIAVRHSSRGEVRREAVLRVP